jgi:hypothetical protein
MYQVYGLGVRVALRARAQQGNWQPQFSRIVIRLSWTRGTEWSSANWGNGNATRGGLRNSTPRQLSKPVFSQLRWAWFLSVTCSNVLLWFICLLRWHERLMKLQSTEQEPGIYDKPHPYYARQDNILDLAWERISHEMKESGSCLSSFETI